MNLLGLGTQTQVTFVQRTCPGGACARLGHTGSCLGMATDRKRLPHDAVRVLLFRVIVGCGQPREHGDLRFGGAHWGRSARGFVITPIIEHLFEHTIPAVGLAGTDGSLNSHASNERDSELLLIIPVACFYA